MNKYLISGEGWRLGYSPDAEIFVGLVGAENWAIELNQQELNDFCRLSLQLAETMTSMQAELAEEENLICSAQTEEIFIEASGLVGNFTIHLQLLNGRRAEGIWRQEAIAEFLNAIRLNT